MRTFQFPLLFFSFTSGCGVSFDAYFQPGQNCEISLGSEVKLEMLGAVTFVPSGKQIRELST